MTKKGLFFALILFSVSGLMLHYRVHNFIVEDKLRPGLFSFSATNFLAFVFPLLDVIVVTLLFTSRKTAVYGYLLNGIIVIYGTVFMAHFSMAQFAAQSTPPREWVLRSTLPDIGIAWGDFFVGYALYELWMKDRAESPV